MIFNRFDETDIVTGRTSRVASGFWPGGVTSWSQSYFVDDFWDATQSAVTPSPSYGASVYDVRSTMYYLNVYPNTDYKRNNDPYFSIAYGSIGGSGSFTSEISTIKANPTKAIYTQYKNLLLGTSDLDGVFTFKSGSTTVTGSDIFVLALNNYKMKDKMDEGLFQITLYGTNGYRTFIDDSSTSTTVQTVYNLISGSLEGGIVSGESYKGVGLFYPQNGIVVFNASLLNNLIGMSGYNTDGGPYSYYYGTNADASKPYTYNHKVMFEAIKAGANSGVTENQMKVRKSEYVPARHYFIRVKNRDFNFSNNPTYVYDGTDGEHTKGTIRHQDFIDDPRTYPTTVGLYNDSNELVAVGKFSRPFVKSFQNEILCKVRLDF